jgi:hypothetical protein
LVAGLLVGYRAARVEIAPLAFSAVAASIALTTGAIGCLTGGALGVAGMVLGFALGLPLLVWVPRHSGS